MIIVDGKEDIETIRQLINEYTVQLGRDLSFQHLEEELQDPAKKYTAPNGEILLAVENGKPCGMVAYHRLDHTVCEMKRLYVRKEVRQQGIGKELVAHILKRAKAAGYKKMVLDTIVPLHAAIHLYKTFGFTTCEAYYDNPMEDVIYMSKELK